MSEAALTAGLLGTFLVLLLIRVPVAFALGVAAFAYAWATGSPPLTVVQKVCVQLGNPTLLAIPFFILTGEIMAEGGMARRLIALADLLVGALRGGLAMVNVVASLFFGGISGSSVADTASIGSVMIPMMVREGYGRAFSVAVTVSSSTQGIIIPPSHNAILYALAAGGAVSIQDLFLAGYMPGLLIGGSLLFLCAFSARRRDATERRELTGRRALAITGGALPALLTPLILIVPIVAGWVPAHQAAVLAVVWSAAASTLIHRSLPLKGYAQVLQRAVRTSSMVLILIGAAAAFGEALTLLHLPSRLTAALTPLSGQPWLLLLALNALLLLLGAVMDMAPLIVILTPILLPVAQQVGVDPVHFGIILLLNLSIGLCTPPVGTTLFVGCSLGGITMEQATRALWPFYIAMIAALLAVTFIPELSLWLPQRVGR